MDMKKKISRNDFCPCGSGKKYKKCCEAQNFEWVEDEDGNIYRKMELNQEAKEVLEIKRREYRGSNSKWTKNVDLEKMASLWS